MGASDMDPNQLQSDGLADNFVCDRSTCIETWQIHGNKSRKLRAFPHWPEPCSERPPLPIKGL